MKSGQKFQIADFLKIVERHSKYTTKDNMIHAAQRTNALNLRPFIAYRIHSGKGTDFGCSHLPRRKGPGKQQQQKFHWLETFEISSLD